MNFQDLEQIENYQFYLDTAFKKAQKRALVAREQIKSERSILKKSQMVEMQKLSVIRGVLYDRLIEIVKSYPSIDQLPAFYQKLIKITLEYDELKKSLGAVNWAAKKVNDLFKVYNERIKRTKDFRKINQYRREFYGRVSSLLKQINDNLLFLENARKIMKGYPTIKTSIPSVVIYGFPNVGKTTLLHKLTGSRPEINSYPFTTKTINISYMEEGGNKIQLLDVPGTLNREKQNDIEKQADLAVVEVAELIVYVLDLSESYPFSDQIKLLKDIKKFNKKTILFLSKKDLAGDKIDEFSGMDFETISEIKDLKKAILNNVSTKK